MEWYPLLPPDLKQAAYKTGNEWAWPKQQALQVIDFLDSNGCVVDGVEPWLPTKPGPTPLIRDWPQVNLSRNNSHPQTAKEFVQNFELIPSERSTAGLAPVFNISAEKKES